MADNPITKFYEKCASNSIAFKLKKGAIFKILEALSRVGKRESFAHPDELYQMNEKPGGVKNLDSEKSQISSIRIKIDNFL